MRAALIGPVPPRSGGLTPGGVATHHVDLAEALAKAGCEIALLATNTSVKAAVWDRPAHAKEDVPYPLYRMIDHAGLNAETVRAFGGYRRLARYGARIGTTRRYGSRREVLRNLGVYRRFLAEVRPDVIHVQHPLERCTYARMVRDIEGWHVPLVVTAHSLFGEHADETIRSLMAPNLVAADRVIAVSEHIADQATELGVDAARVEVIRSGVDTTRFRPRERVSARQRLGLPDAVPLVLFVGNLEPRKQVDVLLRSIAHVRDAVPDVVLLVVGSGESAGVQDQTARLAQLARELALGDRVRFVGRLPDDALLDAYAAADVFALASSSEAQGIVALEAMACGLTVVATAVGGLLGTIEDGQTGLLVPAGDVERLAAALSSVLMDARRREMIGAAARRAVEERFDWAHAARATLGVYRAAMAAT